MATPVTKTPESTAQVAATNKMTTDQAMKMLKGTESRYTQTLTNMMAKNICTKIMAVVLFPLSLVALLFAKLVDVVRNGYNNYSHKAFTTAHDNLLKARMQTAVTNVIPMSAQQETQIAANQQAYNKSLEALVQVVRGQIGSAKWSDAQVFVKAIKESANQALKDTDPAKAEALANDIEAQFKKSLVADFVAAQTVSITPKAIATFIEQFKGMSDFEKSEMETAIIAGMHKKLTSKNDKDELVAKEIDAQKSRYLKDKDTFKHEREKFVDQKKNEKAKEANEYKSIMGLSFDTKKSRVATEDSRLGAATKAADKADEAVSKLDIPDDLPADTNENIKHMKLEGGKLVSEEYEAQMIISKVYKMEKDDCVKYIVALVKLANAQKAVRELTNKADEALTKARELNDLLDDDYAIDAAVNDELQERIALLDRIKEGPEAAESSAKLAQKQAALEEIDNLNERVRALENDIKVVALIYESLKEFSRARTGDQDLFNDTYGDQIVNHIEMLGSDAKYIVWLPLADYFPGEFHNNSSDDDKAQWARDNIANPAVLPKAIILLGSHRESMKSTKEKLEKEISKKEAVASAA